MTTSKSEILSFIASSLPATSHTDAVRLWMSVAWNSEYGSRPQDGSKFLSPWKLEEPYVLEYHALADKLYYHRY